MEFIRRYAKRILLIALGILVLLVGLPLYEIGFDAQVFHETLTYVQALWIASLAIIIWLFFFLRLEA